MSILIEGVDMPRGTNMMLLISPGGDVWEMGDLLGNDKLIEGAKARQAGMFVEKLRGFTDQTIAMAYLYACAVEKYGVLDVQKEWQTMTAQKEHLDRAYTRGRIDEAARWNIVDVSEI